MRQFHYSIRRLRRDLAKGYLPVAVLEPVNSRNPFGPKRQAFYLASADDQLEITRTQYCTLLEELEAMAITGESDRDYTPILAASIAVITGRPVAIDGGRS